MGDRAASHRYVVAIDGPAAAGKSTVAQALAVRLPALLFDTGSLYRALALAALRRDLDLDDGAALGTLAAAVHIDLLPASVSDGRPADVVMNGEDVTWAIRTPEVDRAVSPVARHPEVRSALLDQQRRIAAGGPVVMVGRDVGTVVVPDAGTKVYLDASPAERARRRCDELAARGESVDFDAVMSGILRRDEVDSSRPTSPLRMADDAVRVNTDGIGAGLVVDTIERLVRQRWGAASPAPTASRG